MTKEFAHKNDLIICTCSKHCLVYFSTEKCPKSGDAVLVILRYSRHDICQKIYATAVLGARILRKKHVNRDISQFATKERKCFKMA